jgi:hypothetical protein
MRNNFALQEKFKMAFVLLFIDKCIKLKSKGGNPNITPQLRYYLRVTLVVYYESTF